MKAKVAIPHQREFLAGGMGPLTVYQRWARASPFGFLFESVSGGEHVSRFSFLGAAPAEIYRVYPDRLEVERNGASERRTGAPLERLREITTGVRSAAADVPFTGGFVGWFGYDLVRLIERLPAVTGDPFDLPVAVLARFDDVLVFDHAQQRVLAIANEVEGEVSADRARQRLDELSDLLQAGGERGARAIGTPPPASAARVSLEDSEYARLVTAAREQILAGELLQVVLARRWSLPDAPPPAALYQALRRINPSPYMVLMEFPELALVGASPEMLVRKSGVRIETRPIAGTRSREDDPEADQRLARDLLADPKERAEHVMLVDLGRNDLGRVALPGSVEVSTFMEIERYSHVMHIVSSVEAEVAPEVPALDVLLSCFPAGTVSGAPKVRAMQLIDELEVEGRGPYAGAVGYLAFSGDLDTCITIRTLVVRDGTVSVSAGAGIVADSDPTREAAETENKAAGMLAAIELARRLEASG